jgi:hypothetical protein
MSESGSASELTPAELREADSLEIQRYGTRDWNFSR